MSSATRLCDRAQAGGEYTAATGRYVLLQMNPVGMVEISLEAADQLRRELGEAIDTANRLRHSHATVPIRWKEDNDAQGVR